MPRRAARLRFVWTALVAALAMLSTFESASAEAVPANVVKAGYLRNFAKYVAWPQRAFPDKDAPFVIGVLGHDPFEQILDRSVEGKKIRDRRFTIRRFPVVDGQLPTRELLSGIHVLFVSASERDRLPQIFELLRGTHVMTVSDVEQFAEAGGVAELARIGPHIRVRLNHRAAGAAELKPSYRLLQLAIPVGPRK